jgi:fermentation-respiration switch protein FrsA (DUF1100 family)
MQGRPPLLVRGFTAGFLGALALALWFLAVDIVQGQPFATPGFVAGALLGRQVGGTTLALIAAYTLIHFATFVLVGIAIAWLFDHIDARPRTLFGLVVGFLLFDGVFYFGLVATGINVVRELGWPQVLAGNLLAGLIVMSTLSRMEPGPKPRWSQILAEHRIVKEGLYAGAIGAVSVALWFLAVDAARGQILFTPAALGSALLMGARGVAEVQITAATVLSYTLIHAAAFLLVGFLVSTLAVAAEKQPPIILGLALLFAVFEATFIGLLAIMANWLLGALAWWTIAVANLVAAAAMGAYLWHEHPLLQEELTHNVEEDLAHDGDAEILHAESQS